jgi:hypothetical protein
MIVRRFNLEEDYPVSGLPEGVALPAALVISPGYYTYGGSTYDCTLEGLYRFWHPMVDTQQRIVYQSNVDAMLSALAWICSNGRYDETMTISQKVTRAMNSKLRVLCGKAVEFSKAITDSFAIQSRVVRAHTAQTPNNYYDGHVMLEAKVGGTWKVFDIANDCHFGGLSLRDALPLAAAVQTVPVAADGYSVEPFSAGWFDVTAWQEMTMRTPAQKRAEMERVLQIPGIDHTDGLTYFYMPPGTESRQPWLLGLSSSYRVITQTEWNALFYP